MTRAQIARRRLAGQHLVRPTLTTAEGVVRWLGAVQAQDYAGAKWAVGQRMLAATDVELERAFEAGEIIRTHVLRPTWHFVAPGDLRWMLAATAPRVHVVNAYPYRVAELDARVFRQSEAALTRALRGGKQFTREELRQVFERVRIDVGDSLRFGYLLMRAELDGVLCSGGRRGKQFTYALLEERVPPASPLDADEALGKLATRYFRARGPATLADFTMWAVLTLKDAKRAVEIAESDLEATSIDGRPHWFSNALPQARGTRLRAHLLPNYDEYFIGFLDRSAFSETIRNAGVTPPLAALSAHIITIDGQIVAGWKRTVQGRTVGVVLNEIVRLTPAHRRAIENEIQRYGAFLGQRPVTSFSGTC